MSKGKKWKSTVTVNGKKHTVSHGAKGYRTYPGTKRGDSYCARSWGIVKKYGMTPANKASRQKWNCRGKKSLKK
jgi:hypothetical protein